MILALILDDGKVEYVDYNIDERDADRDAVRIKIGETVQNAVRQAKAATRERYETMARRKAQPFM